MLQKHPQLLHDGLTKSYQEKNDKLKKMPHMSWIKGLSH